MNELWVCFCFDSNLFFNMYDSFLVPQEKKKSGQSVTYLYHPLWPPNILSSIRSCTLNVLKDQHWLLIIKVSWLDRTCQERVSMFYKLLTKAEIRSYCAFLNPLQLLLILLTNWLSTEIDLAWLLIAHRHTRTPQLFNPLSWLGL